MSAKTIRPGVSILERMITSARTGAAALTSELVGHLLTGQRRSDLDRLLAGDARLGMTRLAWLTRPAVEATASAVLASVGKLTYLRNMDAHNAGPVDAAGRAAPVPGNGRPAVHGAGDDRPPGRAGQPAEALTPV